MKNILVQACVFLVVAAALWADEPVQVLRAEKAPVIDGKLDDPVWQQATPFTGFRTYKPDFKKDASQKTDAYVAYDADHLYFAFRAFDLEPNKIKAELSKRDDVGGDYVGIALDSLNDQQGGYLFVVNPLGVQMDSMLNADGNGDGSFDTVWRCQGRIDENGYLVEMAIPWKSLRFPYKKNLVMGLAFLRHINRSSEDSSYPELDPDKGALFSQIIHIEVQGIHYKRVMEFLPALTFSETGQHDSGSFSFGKGVAAFSLTGKLGVTSQLTLDAAYDPDFSQVESDAGQVDVNLRFALYYPEKRPFFLEGLENFSFGALIEQDPLGAVVHTRTIVDPILGVKLNGKVSQRDLVSLVFALDEYPGQVAAEEGDDELAGRNASFTICRYKHMLKNDAFIGGFTTSRDFAGSYSRLVGADGRFRLSNTSIVEFHGFASFNRERGVASGTEGSAVSLRYNYSTRKWYVDTGLIDISTDFRTDVGYLTRSGVFSVPVLVLYSIYPKSKLLQRIETFYWAAHTLDKPSSLFETLNFFVLRLSMPRSSQLRFDAILGNEVFAGERFSVSGGRIMGYTQVLKQLYLEASVRKNRAIYYDPEDPYPGRSTRVSAAFQYQPTDKLTTALGYSYSDFFNLSGEEVYAYHLVRSRTTFQLNKYLFFRAIFEYNFYWKKLTTDFLASFTYIPGTVIYLGYGSLHERVHWDGSEYAGADDFLGMKRSFFFKASYNWRL